eukprot:comp21258_c2_seq1/m.28978 comp21258_c2_seq1/g.28978  ORF comp21258_c2_seq1/g.28978 comp21258_c2_seq1/m.28978 type:complete len:259 (-) comp21258_c2_seq1:56-832(-)
MASVVQSRRSSNSPLLFTTDKQPTSVTSASQPDLALKPTETMNSTTTTITQGTTVSRRPSRASLSSTATKFWRRISVGSTSGFSEQGDGAVIMEEGSGKVSVLQMNGEEIKQPARRRSSAKPKQVVQDLALQLVELRNQLTEEDEVRIEIERSLREAESRMQLLEQAVEQTTEKANQAKNENEKLKGEGEALVGKIKDLSATVKKVEQDVVTERRASETVYGWYMGLMLENEAIRMKLEQMREVEALRSKIQQGKAAT